MRKKLVMISMVLNLSFMVACGSAADTMVAEEKESETTFEASETVDTEENSIVDSVNEAIKNEKFDEALTILENSQLEMEGEEYAILLSNVYLYKKDYVAAADVLVEKISETDSQVLVDRLEYIREKTLAVETRGYDENGNLGYTQVHEYDEEGNVLKLTEYDAEGNVQSGKEYTYDEYGNVTKETMLYVDGSVSNKVINNTYHSNGFLASATACHENGDIISVIEYDEDGNTLLETMYDDGAPFSYYEHTYDENGKEVSYEFRFFEREGGYIHTFEYEYDQDGNVIKEVESDEEGNVESAIDYDVDGNVLKMDLTDFYVSEYKYNSLNDAIYCSTKSEYASTTYDIEYTYMFIGSIEE